MAVSFSDTFVYFREWAFTFPHKCIIKVSFSMFFLQFYCKDIIKRCKLRCVACHDLIISAF